MNPPKEPTRRRDDSGGIPGVSFTLKELLEQINERLQHLNDRMDAELLSIRTRNQHIEEQLTRLLSLAERVASHDTLIETLRQGKWTVLDPDRLISRSEFVPVRNLVYGFVALILTGVVGALLGLVVVGQ